MSLSVAQLRAHAQLAIGGAPASATQYADAEYATVAADQDAMIASTINGAGRFLFSRAWGFRRLPAVTITISAGAEYVELPATAGGFLALRHASDWSRELIILSPESFEQVRANQTAPVDFGERYGTITRSSSAAGAGLGARRLDVWPAPAANEDWRLRSLRVWPTITAATDGADLVPVPDYCEALLIDLVRVFAQGREEDGLSERLTSVVRGPVWAIALQADLEEHPVGDEHDSAWMGERSTRSRFAGSDLPLP